MVEGLHCNHFTLNAAVPVTARRGSRGYHSGCQGKSNVKRTVLRTNYDEKEAGSLPGSGLPDRTCAKTWLVTLGPGLVMSCRPPSVPSANSPIILLLLCVNAAGLSVLLSEGFRLDAAQEPCRWSSSASRACPSGHAWPNCELR